MSGDRLLSLLAAGIAFTLYRLTAFPGIGGRFHPIDPQLHQHYGLVVGPFNSPWHPLYYSLTWLLQWLPLQLSFPERVTLLSAVFGAASVTLAYGVAREMTERKLPAFVAALAYAASFSQWVQSTEAEVYSLQMTLSFSVVLLLLTWKRIQQPHLLWAAIFLYFLSFGVTLSMIVLLPALLFFVASTNIRQIWKPGTLLVIVLSGLVAAAQYVPCYFYAFQAEPLAWGRNRPADLASYLYVVSGDIFHGTFFAFTPSELLLDRLPLLCWYWHREYLLPGAAALFLGLVDLFRRQRVSFLFLVVGFLSVFVFCANYGVDDIEVFLLLSSVFTVPIMAAGVAAVGRHFPERFGVIVVAAYGLLWFSGSLALTFPSFKLYEQPDQPLRRFMSDLEPDALLVNTNYSSGLTMKLRALLFTEPGLIGRKATYLEAGPDLGSRRRILADPDAVVPRALLRSAPAYVLAENKGSDSVCQTRPIGTTLDYLIAEMQKGDRLVLAWSGDLKENTEPPLFRNSNGLARNTLREVGLSGGSGASRYYLGIGCKGSSCQAQETEVNYTNFSLRLNQALSVSGGRKSSLTVEFNDLERGAETAINLRINGADVLAFARRPLSIGFPRSRPGPRFTQTQVADTQLPTGSVAVVIDGGSGEIRTLARAPRPSYELPVFEQLAEYCRVVPRNFDTGGTLALGSAEARLYLGSGFDLDSVDYGRPVVYSTGPRSHVYIPMTVPKSRYRLKVEASLAAGDEQMVMELAVNDQGVYRSSLRDNMLQDIVIDLPAGCMKSGVNHISFHYSRTASYFDLSRGIVKETGQRAVRLYSLSLVPLPE
jgi:hypothetical protein